MKKSALVTVGIAGAGVAALAVAGSGSGKHVDLDDIDLSSCVTDARLQVTASPARIMLGESSVVSWSVVTGPGCSSARIRLNGNPVSASGSRTVTPSATTHYNLTVSLVQGALHQKVASAKLEVAYLPRVVIDASVPDPAGLLLGVLASPNGHQVIELCDVDIDLTGRRNILISDNVSLVAAVPCERGPRRLGPRVFVTDARQNLPLFTVRGDSVVISGFRLEGPTGNEVRGDEKRDKGILISPFPSMDPLQSVEVSNMEIYHWPGVGVEVEDANESGERGRLLNTNESAVRIVGNYFHHDRNVAEGYGVEVANGAFALIARNVFDQNRHAIAGMSKRKDSNDYSGYVARDNLILTGGGYACAEFIFEKCWQTHQIDMHGDDNRWYGNANWQCGVAGETMIIQRNTVLYTKGSAVKIRGNPVDRVVADNNVFKRDSTETVFEQTGACGLTGGVTNPIDVRRTNLFDKDPMSSLDKCDFAGDGYLDEFMATGVTWWARSLVTGQWRHLNTMPEVQSQLSLERVDADAICDVKLKRSGASVYSKGGTGSWTPIQP